MDNRGLAGAFMFVGAGNYIKIDIKRNYHGKPHNMA